MNVKQGRLYYSGQKWNQQCSSFLLTVSKLNVTKSQRQKLVRDTEFCISVPTVHTQCSTRNKTEAESLFSSLQSCLQTMIEQRGKSKRYSRRFSWFSLAFLTQLSLKFIKHSGYKGALDCFPEWNVLVLLSTPRQKLDFACRKLWIDKPLRTSLINTKHYMSSSPPVQLKHQCTVHREKHCWIFNS